MFRSRMQPGGEYGRDDESVRRRGRRRVRASSLNDHDFAVVSTFFPTWLDGQPEVVGFATVPGDGVDGYAREAITAPATAFTHAPAGWDHAEAATLTTAGLTAWRALHDDGKVKAGDTVLMQGCGPSMPTA